MPAKKKVTKVTSTKIVKKQPVSLASVEQTHGALPSIIDMNVMFGIKKAYKTSNLDEYRAQIKAYSSTELAAHSHDMGVIPMDPKEKLIAALERKFLETISRGLPMRVIPPATNPDMLAFHKKFMAGDL